MATAVERSCMMNFINEFKKEYSRYFSRKYSIARILKKTDVSLKEISDLMYMRNCVAYILRNPVDSRLVKDAGQYRWSSVGCYFKELPLHFYTSVASMRIREIRQCLHTHHDISGSNLLVDGEYHVMPSSFVNRKFVEGIFNASQEFFWNKVSKVDSAQMEYELVIGSSIAYNDSELIPKVNGLVLEWFNKDSLSQLDIKEKCRMAGYLYRRFSSGVPQIARLLGIDRNTVRRILGL
ncbi:MAG: hypothetical protein NC308_04765 [Clostridium sp.]|nr:hypothetical protein [Bacteroides sp.]MCM1198180.1 hypothetical protein [Clostridium sp.]